MQAFQKFVQCDCYAGIAGNKYSIDVAHFQEKARLCLGGGVQAHETFCLSIYNAELMWGNDMARVLPFGCEPRALPHFWWNTCDMEDRKNNLNILKICISTLREHSDVIHVSLQDFQV